jgi:RecB family exonuclease
MATDNKKTIVVVDVATGETIERAMTSAELEAQSAVSAEALVIQNAMEAKAAARESALAKLADLGLTAEEIAAI